MKVGELTVANNDMKNLLDSTNIATLFLDKGLRIRRFTPQTALVFRLIPEDVGRPIFDIVSQLEYPMLSSDIEEVLAKGISIEKQIHTGNNL
jgi:two-component system CheB/CheR fusion protein